MLVFPEFNMSESAFCILTRVGCIVSAWLMGLVAFLNVFLQLIFAFAGDIARVADVLIMFLH